MKKAIIIISFVLIATPTFAMWGNWGTLDEEPTLNNSWDNMFLAANSESGVWTVEDNYAYYSVYDDNTDDWETRTDVETTGRFIDLEVRDNSGVVIDFNSDIRWLTRISNTELEWGAEICTVSGTADWVSYSPGTGKVYIVSDFELYV